MTHRIITISRQFGSGGRLIGRAIAQHEKFEFYDKEIIEQISERSGFSKEYIKEEDEVSKKSGLLEALTSGDFYEHSSRVAIWEEQCSVILQMAEKGPCVFVGRAADYILKSHYPLLKVFVYADNEFKIAKVMEQRHLNRAEAIQKITDMDKRREMYYELFTDQKYGDMANYNLCLNASMMSVEECAQIIIETYKVLEKGL